MAPYHSLQRDSDNIELEKTMRRLQSLEAIADGTLVSPRPSEKKPKPTRKLRPLGTIELVTSYAQTLQASNDHDNAGSESSPQGSHATKSYAKFTLFSDLPTELRLKIWKMRLRQQDRLLICDKGFRIQVPAPLHVCHESRTEPLKRFELARPNKDPREIYMDFTNDVIFFNRDSPAANDSGYEDFLSDLNPEFLCKVQHLSLPSIFWNRLRQHEVVNRQTPPTDIRLSRMLIHGILVNAEVLQSITVIWAQRGEGLGKWAKDATAVEFIPGARGGLAGTDFDRFVSAKIKYNWRWSGQLLIGSYKNQESLA